MSQKSRKSHSKHNDVPPSSSSEEIICCCQQQGQKLDNDKQQELRFEHEFDKLNAKLVKELDLAYKLPAVGCCPCDSTVGRDYLEETCSSQSTKGASFPANNRTGVCCSSNYSNRRNEASPSKRPQTQMKQVCSYCPSAGMNQSKGSRSKCSSKSSHNRANQGTTVEKTLILNAKELASLTSLLSRGNAECSEQTASGKNYQGETSMMLDANTVSELLRLLSKER